MTLALLALAALAVSLVIAMLVETSRNGLTFGQAFLLAPLKLLHRIDTRRFVLARKAQKPVIYAVSEQSRIDPVLMMALLPADTLHVLDPAMKGDWLAETARGLTRSVFFDKEHMVTNRRLLKHLKGGGRLAVYLPDNVAPDATGFRLYRAVALMARKTGARIVTIAVDGSRHHPGSFTPQRLAPRHRFVRLTPVALPGETIDRLIESGGRERTTPANAVFDRMALARMESHDRGDTLHGALVAAARRYGMNRVALEDTVTGTLTFARLLAGARVLGRRFTAMTAEGEAVGVLLPNANGAIVTFFALQSAGRVAAMLNYTAGPASIASAIDTAKIRVVLSSRAFIEKAQLEDLVAAIGGTEATIVWLEDLREKIGGVEKVLGLVLGRFPLARRTPADPAVILFTSGSEGTPKGVVLSSRNLLVNADQAESRFPISPADTLFNVLPVFHSFGLTGGAILPLMYGVKLFLYPSPLHYKLIPSVAAKVKPTIMFGTDTFLTGYARAAREKDFESLRFAVAGAEAVKAETRRQWRDRFDVYIFEGYGMTEAAPVVAVNTYTHDREGTVGRLLPGMDIRLEPVEGIEGAGRMWVRGPNVMLGYMTADRPGVLQPLSDGWHDSGDIVAVDRDGFVAIRGRAKRFAKIAGEMVSLGAVEMLVQKIWPEDRHAAVAIPDRRKGERIILATTHRHADRVTIHEYGRHAGLTELMIPSDVITVEDIPVLGSGKTDYVTTRKVIEDALKSEKA